MGRSSPPGRAMSGSSPARNVMSCRGIWCAAGSTSGVSRTAASAPNPAVRSRVFRFRKAWFPTALRRPIYWNACASHDAAPYLSPPLAGRVGKRHPPTLPLVGATLVVALLSADAVREPGDHKGRPYSQAMLEDVQ